MGARTREGDYRMGNIDRLNEIMQRCEAAKRHLAEHRAGNWEAHYARDMTFIFSMLTNQEAGSERSDSLKESGGVKKG